MMKQCMTKGKALNTAAPDFQRRAAERSTIPPTTYTSSSSTSSNSWRSYIVLYGLVGVLWMQCTEEHAMSQAHEGDAKLPHAHEEIEPGFCALMFKVLGASGFWCARHLGIGIGEPLSAWRFGGQRPVGASDAKRKFTGREVEGLSLPCFGLQGPGPAQCWSVAVALIIGIGRR